MSIIENLSNRFIIDACNPPASLQEIEEFKQFSNIELPTDYLRFIQEQSEVQMSVKNEIVENDIYLRFWDIMGCMELNPAYKIQKYLSSESLAIGDNGGSDALVYMHGNEGFGLYRAAFSNLTLDDAVKIAPTLSDLLLSGVGIDKLIE